MNILLKVITINIIGSPYYILTTKFNSIQYGRTLPKVESSLQDMFITIR